MNADVIDDNLVRVFDEQDKYVQILGMDTEDGNEDVEIVSLNLDGEESVFIDIESDSEDYDPTADTFDDLAE